MSPESPAPREPGIQMTGALIVSKANGGNVVVMSVIFRLILGLLGFGPK